MNRSVCSILVAVLQITNWALATNGLKSEGIANSSQVVYRSKQAHATDELNNKFEEEEYREPRTSVGSRPPNCEHRCDGCDPCYAIQVPHVTDHFGLLFANYEPEGWKCKCDTSFFNP